MNELQSVKFSDEDDSNDADYEVDTVRDDYENLLNRRSESKSDELTTKYTFRKAPSDFSRGDFEEEDEAGAEYGQRSPLNNRISDGGNDNVSSTVAISLVESVLLHEGSAGEESENYYVVEYDSDNQGA